MVVVDDVDAPPRARLATPLLKTSAAPVAVRTPEPIRLAPPPVPLAVTGTGTKAGASDDIFFSSFFLFLLRVLESPKLERFVTLAQQARKEVCLQPKRLACLLSWRAALLLNRSCSSKSA
jgi:hypothetical protein